MRTLFSLKPEKYVHLEFHMESLGIPSEMQINSIEWHIWWVSAPESIRTRTESLKIRNKYSESTFCKDIFTWNFTWNHIESLGIPSEIEWLRMAHTGGLHITDHLELSGKHKNSKELS